MDNLATLKSYYERACRLGDNESAEAIADLLDHPYYAWMPRSDNSEQYDEQHSFCYSQDDIVCCLAGNSAGKSAAAAWKVAHFLCEWQEPFLERTPFWIISDFYEQSCGMGWAEKLSKFLPPSEICWDEISWIDRNKQWPSAVPLRRKPNGNRWVLEFKSYEQGRTNMQARSLGGFWFSEQFPWEIFVEVLRGCREAGAMLPGGQIIEFTPVDPSRSSEIQKIYEAWQAGDEQYSHWGFYRLNTLCNTANNEAWTREFFNTVSEEMRATRQIGAFASYEGLIYPAFNPREHCVSGLIERWNDCVLFRRAVDWGASAEHAFVCLWAGQLSTGQWLILDEYRSNEQISLLHHIEAIKNRHYWPEQDSRYGTCWADSADPAAIQLFLEFQIATQGAFKDVLPGIEVVRRAMETSEVTGEPGLLIDLEHCPWLIKGLQKYRWMRSHKPGQASLTLNPKAARPEPLKKDDDEVDALRYLCFSEARQRGMTPDSMRLEAKQRRGMELSGVGRALTMRREGGGLFPMKGRQGRR